MALVLLQSALVEVGDGRVDFEALWSPPPDSPARGQVYGSTGLGPQYESRGHLSAVCQRQACVSRKVRQIEEERGATLPAELVQDRAGVVVVGEGNDQDHLRCRGLGGTPETPNWDLSRPQSPPAGHDAR